MATLVIDPNFGQCWEMLGYGYVTERNYVSRAYITFHVWSLNN